MINSVVKALSKAVRYAIDHPQILFAFVLVIMIPLLFLYTGQQFLNAGKENQDRLQKDRIGLMTDSFAALLSATNFDPAIAKNELDHIRQLNPDITDYIVSKQEGTTITPIIASATSSLTSPLADIDLYRNASVRTDTSIIFESFDNSIRYWSAYRAVASPDGQLYFLFARFSMDEIDSVFAAREQGAYVSLLFLYFFMIALAFWHIKLTDYRYLYMKAQKTNQMKDIFTNMIAHELRAPLTAIKGYAAMLEEKAADDELKKYSSRIKDSAERLIAIVSDLLDVARIQSGKLSINIAEANITPIVSEVLDELKVSAMEKGITLQASGAEVEHTTLCDAQRLHQALTNLVSNAIKYTKTGTITLELSNTHAATEIRVKDTGMGIEAKDQKNLFAPFFRVANAEVDQITGSGLGMWITKQLIELMGGTVGVESIKGIGTHVIIRLPNSLTIPS